MDHVSILAHDILGRDFIPAEFLPGGKDEYYLRDSQLATKATWRHLRAFEIEELVKNANTCSNWDELLVTDLFDPSRIKNSEFFGLVRIGRLQNIVLQHHDLQVPAGITNSRIIACDICDDVAIHNVRYLAHYIIGERCILVNIDEMHTTNHAKFGNGIVKEGETEDVRVWLELVNEVGGRSVMPFDGMITADAYLWSKCRDDEGLQQKLGVFTQQRFDNRRGYYGTVDTQSVIKSCGIIKDVKIGSCCYIKGANKMKNLTINSSEAEPTQIGEGVELVNGIIGYGSHIFYGCKAVRFILGNNSNLKYGARLIHSFLGDNSTVSCCEILNVLIFPAHEQHHNNSFLTAAMVLGQSNVPAGATIGSNHNSRANDGEIVAGRGFWPALCTTIKHSCRFASFTLLSKSNYPAELDIALPFALISNDEAHGRLTVMPAYWWRHNMYALARNAWKFKSRDKRKTRIQNIEFDYLAPDTVEELFTGRALLEQWAAKSFLAHNNTSAHMSSDELAMLGAQLLTGAKEGLNGCEVVGERCENSRRPTVILKPAQGYQAYGQMINYYAVKNLMEYLESDPTLTFTEMSAALAGAREITWVNMGGQLMAKTDYNRLIADIKSGTIASWDDMHAAYAALWQEYPLTKQRHAYASLCALRQVKQLSREQWLESLNMTATIQEYVRDQVYLSRKKDFDSHFRTMTCDSPAEVAMVMGSADGNSFIKQVRAETDAFKKRVETLLKRG
jgi:hypothetical protein